MSDTPLHSAGFPGYCSLMDLNGCVFTCMRFPLLFEPLKIYHRTPADDLLQAVNSLIRHNIRARKNFFTHSTDCTCRGIRNGSNHTCHSVTFWFPGYCGFADLKGYSVFRRRFALYATCAGFVSLLKFI